MLLEKKTKTKHENIEKRENEPVYFRVYIGGEKLLSNLSWV